MGCMTLCVAQRFPGLLILVFAMLRIALTNLLLVIMGCGTLSVAH
jgi:hypothetical protein